MKTSELQGMHFEAALERFNEMRIGKVAPRTSEDDKAYVKRLCRTFREICEEREFAWENFLIDTPDGDWCRWYQVRRNASPGVINKEIGLVRLVRKQIAASGSELKQIKDYQRLQLPKEWESPGRRLEPEEDEKWEAVCVENADDPSLEVGALTSLVMLKTGAGPGELKSIKMKNVHLAKELVDGSTSPTFFRIDRSGAKRKRRERKVICDGVAEWALKKLYDRAIRLGCNPSSDHYLIPRMNRNHTYDPTRKAKSWWNSFHRLLELAGLKFRNYDHRHTAVSVRLEDPELSFAECELYFGHISAAMKDRYYHGTTESLLKVARSGNKKNGHEVPKKPPLEVSNTKKCSECWSDIPLQAKRCRYCQAVLVRAAAAAD